MQEWFSDQKVPGTNYGCCDVSDGEFVVEEIRYDQHGVGHYWVRFSKTGIAFIPVPEQAVIDKPNFHGRPVVWYAYSYDDGETITGPLYIRYYGPGGKA
jgi:hypothetical protein